MPCYNVEKVLASTINSVVSQTYKNLEIILVDDGSTDRTGAICDEYMAQDSRIIVIHKKNGGPSDSRNQALDIVKGEYIAFVDSDDYIYPDYIELLYDLIIRNNVQLSICSWKCVVENNSKSILQPKIKVELMNSHSAIETMFYQKKFDTSPCCKLYHKDLFSGIRFPTGYIYEDLATIYKLLYKVGQIAYTNRICYIYIMRYNSLLYSRFNENKYSSLLMVSKVLSSFVYENDRKLLKPLRCRLTSLYFNIFFSMLDNDNYYKYIWQNIKKNRIKVIFDNNARLKTRVGCLLSLCGKNLLRYAFKFVNLRKL